MEKLYIAHHGIDGQKWGVRRYQNEDGTYTEEGKERRRIRDERMNRAFSLNVKNGKDKPNTSRAAKIASETTNISGNASKISRRYSKPSREDLSKYSDEDLRKMVNRGHLEQQYRNLNYSYKKTGMEKVADVLDTVGDVAAIGVSAAMIYSLIKEIKG